MDRRLGSTKPSILYLISLLYCRRGVSDVVPAAVTLRSAPAARPVRRTIRRTARERERAADELAPPEAVAAPAVAEAAPAEPVHPVAVAPRDKRKYRTGEWEDRHHNRRPEEWRPEKWRPEERWPERRPGKRRSARPAWSARSAGTSKTIWHVKTPFKYTLRDVLFYESCTCKVQVHRNCIHTFSGAAAFQLLPEKKKCRIGIPKRIYGK